MVKMQYESTRFFKNFLDATFESAGAAVQAKDFDLVSARLHSLYTKFRPFRPRLHFERCCATPDRRMGYANFVGYLDYSIVPPELSFWGIKNQKIVYCISAILSRFI
jgi:hypothetical protein